ncbi:MAG: translation initiation factor IF-2 [Acidimicrobiales bacterium]|nr:translation initiation factor IF-2 [Acidimicrobiales bacterium]
MPAKVRVYDLARELDITNKQVIALCESLGIEASSHSSSLVVSQADRVRKKAESEGLLEGKETAPEPVTEKLEATTAQKPVVEKMVQSKNAVSSKKPPQKKPEPVEKKPEHNVNPSAQIVTSKKPSPNKPTVEVEKTEKDSAPQPVKEAEKKPPVQKASPEEVGEATANQAPVSPSGKRIPPPPSPRSASGKPIPPPPGKGGRGNVRPERNPQSYRTRPNSRTTQTTEGRPSGRKPSSDTAGKTSRGTGFSPPGSAGPGAGKPGAGRSSGRPGGPQRPQRKKKSRRRRRQEELQPMDAPAYTPEDTPVPEGEVVIERASSSIDIAPKLNRTTADVVRYLMEQGEMVTATQSLSDEMIEVFAAEIGAEVRLVDPGEEHEMELLKRLEVEQDVEISEDWPARPPVVTVMGHVDHGKTKLLDQIRNADVTAGEAGGITQHIGAYQVQREDHILTFLDTPGHAAFTSMRARGANVTDIVILVVAADDGVMPQTVEAINHAKAAEVPIIVAVNKIDLESADPQRVLAELAERGLVPESWGGDTIVVEVSALENTGIEELLENILLMAEVEDLRSPNEGRGQGVVLESHLDTGRGPVATVLVQRGTLSVGEPLVAGSSWGRVRALVSDSGEQVDSAGPSFPVQVLGLSSVASAGDDFVVAPDERTARDVAGTREHFQRVGSIGRDSGSISGGRLEDLFSQISAGEKATLNLILKADVNGSLEAVIESLKKLEREEVNVAFIHSGVGAITENDIQLAATSNATVLGFNVRPDRKAREMADHENVEIRNYEIIYKLLEDIESAMVGMLVPEFEEIVTGDAEVREIYKIPRVGAIAGCYVLEGKISRGSKVRFLRDGTIIWKGDIQSLRRFKEDVQEVSSGYECGIGLSDFQDLKDGDIIETYDEREITPS